MTDVFDCVYRNKNGPKSVENVTIGNSGSADEEFIIRCSNCSRGFLPNSADCIAMAEQKTSSEVNISSEANISSEE